LAADHASENAKLYAAINAALLAVEDVLEETPEVVEVPAIEEETTEETAVVEVR
jgi:hypothetical protein